MVLSVLRGGNGSRRIECGIMVPAVLSRDQYEILIEQAQKEGFIIVDKGNFIHKADNTTTVNLGWMLVPIR